MIATPKVFISSTYFDLRQVRKDLGDSLSKLGYDVLRSELNVFPIDPDSNTIDNCTRNVDLHADLFILIIGGRYGYIDTDSGKSVTNLEYTRARYKGIPIYVFIEQNVLNQFELYKMNPNGGYDDGVDNPLLFEFIGRIREEQRQWTNSFSTVQDIISTLRSQLGFLLGEGLFLRRVLKRRENEWMRSLTPEAVRLVLERPAAWPARLFSQVLSDEIENLTEIRWEHEYGLVFGRSEKVSLVTSTKFIQTRVDESKRVVKALALIFPEVLMPTISLGEAKADARRICFAAKQIAQGYKELIRISQDFRRTHLPDVLRPLYEKYRIFHDPILKKIQEFGPHNLEMIQSALSDDSFPGELVFNLVLGVDDTVVDEIERMTSDLIMHIRKNASEFDDSDWAE